MHYQAPHDEAKLVRCTAGARVRRHHRPPAALAHLQAAIGEVLSAGQPQDALRARGFAHGFQTLEDDTEVFYQMSQFYSPGHSRGVRWNDPAFGIAWP